jgi:hypothetical protein
MFNKATTLIIVILVIISIGLVILSFSNSLPENDGTNPISFPIDESRSTSFVEDVLTPEYAYIKNGYIYISYTDGSFMPVEIENTTWRNVKVSETGKALAAIGKEGNGSEDVYVYNIERQEFNKMTFFQDEQTGVTDFFWIDDRVIAFHQDGWLHSLNTTSREIVKIQSGISSFTGSTNGFVAMNNTQNKGMIYDFEQGEFISGIDTQILSATKKENTSTILFNDGIYTLENGNLEKISNLQGNMICGELIVSPSIATNYTNNALVSTTLPSMTMNCSKNELYFKIENKWYTLDNKEIPEITNTTYFDKF